MLRNHFRHLGLGLLVIGSPAWAAAGTDTAGANGQLEEIVVTAEKRTENVQQVPIAITAITADALQARGITDVRALSELSSNVNLDAGSPFSGSSAVLSASIRGIGQDDFGFNLDPGVGVYLDGIYLARTVGSNLTLPDVERIEILKGPQGTLFGRNTIGGAISIVTHDPGTTPSFDFQAETGSFYRHDFQVKVDAPIMDTLLSTVTISSSQRDGYQKRIAYPNAGNYVTDPINEFPATGYDTYKTQGGEDEQVFRGKLVWKPIDDFKTTLAGDWTHHNQPSIADTVLSDGRGSSFNFFNIYNACINLNQAQAIAAGLYTICSQRAGAGSLVGANLNPATARLPFTSAVYQTGDIDSTYATGLNFDNLDSGGAALTLDWRFNESLAVKSITGYRRTLWKVGVDEDGSPITGVDLSFEISQHQISQEFQLLGNALGERLNYIVGLYYFNEKGFDVNDAIYPLGFLQIYGVNQYDTSSYAGFIHADYKVTDQLSVTVGGRYSVDNKSFYGDQEDLNGLNYKITNCYPPGSSAAALGAPAGVTCQQALGFPDPANPLRYQPDVKDTQNFSEFTPTAGIQYQWTRDLMTYFSYSKGFKSGGWTTRLTDPAPQQPAFGPEKAQTYEIGMKSEWFDRRFLANVAGFYTKYDNIQLNFFDALSPAIENGGNAKLLGAEVETKAIFGEGLSLRANIGYIDAYYTEVNAQTGLTLESELPKTPKFKINIGPEYDLSLRNGATVRMILDYTHTTSMYNDAQDTEEFRRPDTNVLDMSVAYITPSGRYQIAAGGTNITDDRYLTTASGASSTTNFGTYNPPAEWYLRMRAHF